ncbi:MAG: DNA gyrase modulator, partial [Cyanobacteria bacterium J06639_18]
MPPLLADTKNLLADLIAHYSSKVDYLMIRLEESEGTDILLRGGKVETLSEGISIGGQVRACYRGGWGLSSFNQLASLKERIEEAIASARMVGDEETILAPIEPIQAV